jgi:hypothetical protein
MTQYRIRNFAQLSIALCLALLLAAGCGPWGKSPSTPTATLTPTETPDDQLAAAEENDAAPDHGEAVAGAEHVEDETLQQRLERIRLAVDNYQSRPSKPDAGATSADHHATQGAPAETSPATSQQDAAAESEQDDAPVDMATVSIVAIRPAIMAAPDANGAATAQAGASATPTLDALVDHYQKLAAAHPGNVEVVRTLRVLQLMAGETDASLEPVAGLSPEDQRLWRGLIWAMANARDTAPAGAGTGEAARQYQAAQVLAVLDELRADLQRQAPLEIPVVKVCQRVAGFGVIVPLPQPSVRPLDRVSIYTEVRNFVSERQRDDTYHVRLNQFLNLKDAAGRVVWKKEYRDIDDRCRTVRQDFFLTSSETIPADLPSGAYTLEVTVEDVLGRKQAVGSTELVVSAATR